MKNWLLLTLIALLSCFGAVAFGQSMSSDGSGTLTIAGRKYYLQRVSTDLGGRRARVSMWTTDDERFDLVGESSRDENSYKLRLDDGLGKSNLTGFANVYTSDWRTMKSFTASGRFSGGAFDVNFAASKGGQVRPDRPTRPNPGDNWSDRGRLTMNGRGRTIRNVEYKEEGDRGFRLILTDTDGNDYHLVGRRTRNGNRINLSVNDGLGKEDTSGSGTVFLRDDRPVSASGNGRYRGGSYNYSVTFGSGSGSVEGGNSDSREVPSMGGRLRFDNNSLAVTGTEFTTSGDNFRLKMFTSRGDRFDVVGAYNDASGNRYKLYVKDGLGKSEVEGTGTVTFNRGRATSITVNGRYRGGSFSVTLDLR